MTVEFQKLAIPKWYTLSSIFIMFVFLSYLAQAYNMSKPYLDSASNSYNDYVNYVSQMDTSAMTNMADAYTSTIYGARDYMNAGLDSVMAHPVMQQVYITTLSHV